MAENPPEIIDSNQTLGLAGGGLAGGRKIDRKCNDYKYLADWRIGSPKGGWLSAAFSAPARHMGYT